MIDKLAYGRAHSKHDRNIIVASIIIVIVIAVLPLLLVLLLVFSWLYLQSVKLDVVN